MTGIADLGITFTSQDWEAQHDDSALAHIERALIGTFLIFPLWLDEAALVEPRDFQNKFLGVAFGIMRKFPGRAVDGLVLAAKLEEAKVPCPEPHGWVATLAGYMDRNVLHAREDVARYVRIVREASTRRRMSDTHLPNRGRGV